MRNQSKPGRGGRHVAAVLLVAVMVLFAAACGVDSASPSSESGEAIVSSAAPQAQSSRATAGPVGSLPPALLAAHIAATQRDAGPEYAVTEVRPGTGAYRASHRGARIAARFDASGASFSQLGDTAGWSLGLSLGAYGCRSEVVALSTAAPMTEGNRVEYARGQGHLSEWFLNGPLGIEHGFTLHRPLSCPAGEPIVLQLPVTGTLEPAAIHDDQEIELRNDQGEAVLRYGALFAHDADNKELRARFAVVDRTIRIELDADTATFPVTVDPLLAAPQTKLMLGDNGWRAFNFGYSFAQSGTLAVIGNYCVGFDLMECTGEALVYGFDSTTAVWSRQARLLADDGSVNDYFGWSVAIDGTTVVVGAPNADGAQVDQGAAYVFRGAGLGWYRQGKLLPSDPVSNRHFGRSVTVADSTNTAVVASENGHIYAYLRTGSSWAQQQKLLGQIETNSYFDPKVSVSADTLLIGNGAASEARVWVRTGTVWASQQTLVQAATDFGASVSVDASTNTALIGAPGADDKGTNAGAAFVYLRVGTVWSQQAKLLASDGVAGDTLGAAVALRGNVAVLGAPLKTVGSGAAYVYTRAGTIWTQRAKLLAPDGAVQSKFAQTVSLAEPSAGLYTILARGADFGDGTIYAFEGAGADWVAADTLQSSAAEAMDGLGSSVALDNDTAVVGGATGAYVFVRTGSVWVQQAVLNPTTCFGGRFGRTVAIRNNTILVGAPECFTTVSGSGAAFVFVRDLNNVWKQEAILQSTPIAGGDGFGSSVALSGETAVVGARDKNKVGAAFVFVRGGKSWTQQAQLVPSPQPVYFGDSVAIDKDTAVVGGFDSSSSGTMSTHVFVRSGTSWSQQQVFAIPPTSVAVSGDTLMIGNSYNADQGQAAGAAWFYVRNGTTWAQQGPTLYATNAASGMWFGGSVSLDGDYAVVGARGNATYGAQAGAAYLYWRIGTTWSASQVFAPDPKANTHFGAAVSLRGSTMVIGAPWDNTKDYRAGAAYPFVVTRDNGDPCNSSAQCASKHCIDGVCCNVSCIEFCYACTKAKKGGGLDGECGPVGPGLDLDGECDDDTASSCGRDGTCDGLGKCRLYPAGTGCGANVCVVNETRPVYCNGFGSCQPAATGLDCSPHVCAAGACPSSCKSDNECTIGHFCDGDCAPKGALGKVCGSANECLSGVCLDGHCCQFSSCPACTACDSTGQCGNVAAGKDPKGDCPDEGSSSCGRSGGCDGQGACELYGATTQCGQPYCDGNQSKELRCNGLGQCASTSGTACGAYLCKPGLACPISCATGSDCAPGFFCGASNTCVDKLAQGQPCTGSNQCASGFCADGFCCNQACTGLCRACSQALKGSGADGECANLPINTDPNNECDPDPNNPCGPEGSCNGLGGCKVAGAGTACGSGSSQCVNNVVTGQVCNGSGQCTTDLNGIHCAPYLCQGAACGDACVSDTQCVNDAFCNSTGACVTKGAVGAPCGDPKECGSGFCVDGFCCDSACAGTCLACAADLKTFGANGQCGPAKDGTDPHNSCVTEPATTCMFNGLCDGAGKCQLYPSTTPCGLTECQGNLVKGKTCDGQGNCALNTDGTDCALYLCQAGACLTSCKSDTHCAEGAFCSAKGTCEATAQVGAACAESKGCASGFCVDGVCCSTACAGQCEACNEPSAVGTCKLVVGAPRGTREPCSGGGTACGGSCDGAESGTCAYPGAAQGCGSSCTNGLASTNVCSGNGKCLTSASTACAPFGCAAEQCKTACADDKDCAAGFVCDTASKKCLPKSGAQCDGEHTVSVPGTSTMVDCTPYKCSLQHGNCLASCASDAECVAGFACSTATSKCVVQQAPAAPSSEEGDGGCGCSMPGRRPVWSPLLALMTAALLGSLRRRRARRGTAVQ